MHEITKQILELVTTGRVRAARELWNNSGRPDPEIIIRHPWISHNPDFFQEILDCLPDGSMIKGWGEFQLGIANEYGSCQQTFPSIAPVFSYKHRFEHPYFGTFEEGENFWLPGVITYLVPGGEAVYFLHTKNPNSDKPIEISFIEPISSLQEKATFDLNAEAILNSDDPDGTMVFIVCFYKENPCTTGFKNPRIVKVDLQFLRDIPGVPRKILKI